MDNLADLMLHAAVYDDDARLVKLAIDAGADINAKDNEGNTPLHIAAEGKVEAVKALLSAGADINAKNNEGYTPLYIATVIKKYPCIAKLIAESTNQ